MYNILVILTSSSYLEWLWTNFVFRFLSQESFNINIEGTFIIFFWGKKQLFFFKMCTSRTWESLSMQRYQRLSPNLEWVDISRWSNNLKSEIEQTFIDLQISFWCSFDISALRIIKFCLSQQLLKSQLLLLFISLFKLC